MTNSQQSLSPFEAARELLNRRTARASLKDFTAYTKPDYDVNWHHTVLCCYLDRLIAGEIKRLMVFMPPRHGKSELVSRRLPAYILGRNPMAQIIACSYSADLASRMNRDVQRIIDSDPYRMLFPKTRLFGSNVRTTARGSYLRNSDIFEVVGHGGCYRSAGVGGGITGMGFNFGIIDDPIKNREEAESRTYRENLWDWYTSTFYTRQEKGSVILVTLTRWHGDDLAGRLISLAQEESADPWTIIKFPAIKENDDKDDPRAIGEPLWPAKYDLNALGDTRSVIGPRDWAALYQQDPQPEGGSVFQVAWFKREDAPDHGQVQVVQAWDTAFKAGQENDYSVCVTLGQFANQVHVLNVWRGRVGFPELLSQMKRQAEMWSPNVIVVEDKGSGTSALQELRSTNLPVVAVQAERDKVQRANLITGMCEAGRVSVPATWWGDDLIDELIRFPAGAHDDQVDALVYGLMRLRTKPLMIGWA